MGRETFITKVISEDKAEKLQAIFVSLWLETYEKFLKKIASVLLNLNN
jgi:hypothetical protein